MAQENNSVPNNNVGEQLEGANDETLVPKLPKLDTLRRCIRRQRHEQERYPPILMDSHEYIVIEDEQFLQFTIIVEMMIEYSFLERESV